MFESACRFHTGDQWPEISQSKCRKTKDMVCTLQHTLLHLAIVVLYVIIGSLDLTLFTVCVSHSV